MSAARLACAALLVTAIGAFLAPHKPLSAPTAPANVTVSDPAAATRQLSGFLRIRTVGDADAPDHVGPNGMAAFTEALQFLSSNFPAAWERLNVMHVANFSLLLHWGGSNSALKPAALLSHMDVVPENGNWTQDAFGGDVVDGYIYGRGALDLKSNVIAILHAVDQLCTEGFQPQRSLYVAFGHDEELGGAAGAVKIVELLESQKVELEWVLDEGGVVIKDGLPPLTNTPIAVVGTAEKDYSVVEVEVKGAGGHAMMPPVDGSSVGAAMARILTAVDKSPPPVRFQPPMTDFMAVLADVAPVKGLRWLLKHPSNPVVARLLGIFLTRAPDTAGLVRTTAAPVRVEVGTANNVLPGRGTVAWNFRHLPGHTAGEVLAYVRGKIPAQDRPHATVRRLDRHHWGSHISPLGENFDMISRVIKETMAEPGSDIIVAPYLVVGGTDSKHYSPLTKCIYRFEPVSISRRNKDLARVHGADERISEHDLVRSIRFFLQLIRTSCGSVTPA